jgi:colicin import membrane protein
MTAIAARTLPRPRDHDAVPSFAAALAMHAALVGWMWFAVQWHTSASAPAVAELWDLAPPTLAVAPAPAPEPPAAPTAPPPSEVIPPPNADILQKAATPRRAPEATPKEAPKKDKKAKPVHNEPTAQELRRQQAQAERQRQDEMTRLASQAQATARTPTVSSMGPISNEYSAKIQSAVRAHLSYAVPEGVAPTVYAEFAVELLPTGEQAAEPRLVKPSGLPGFDEAARRAILRTDPFPRRDDGTVPRSLSLRLYPQDTR